MTDKHYEWARAEERALARYVQPNDLPAEFGLPAYINRFDLLQADGPSGVAAQLYALIRKQAIQYELAPFNPRSGVTQLIRKPTTILSEKRATCLDLAVLFATMCLANDLLPLLAVVDGHAFAGLSLTRTRHEMKNAPKALAWNKGELTIPSVLQELAEQEYLYVECTGAAQSQALSATFPEGRGREGSGAMSFERACVAGNEQIRQHIRMEEELATPDRRVFLYALDIHDLQVNHGFEPVQDDGISTQLVTQIDGRNSQGLLNQPTGPITQHFGNQQNVSSSGDTLINDGPGAVATRGGVAAGAGGLAVGGDVHGHINTGDQITVGNITDSSGIAIGPGAQASVTTGVSGTELASLFADIYRRIEARSPDAKVDKDEVKDKVGRIEKEASKQDAASEQELSRWLRELAEMAPDIFDVTVAALTSPVAAMGTVVRKITERAKQSWPRG